MRGFAGRIRAKWLTWRHIDDHLTRRAEVESYLVDCYLGQRPLPDAETCRLLALKLGTPTRERRIRLPRKPFRVV